MKKVIMPIILVFIMAFSLISCGKATSPAIGEGVVVKDTEQNTEAEEKDIPDGEVPAIGKLEEVTNPTAEPTTETTEPESTAPPHVHDFKVESSTEATCAVAGEKKLVCECGDSIVEEIPATGNHDWEPVYQAVTHPSLGHVEEVKVQVGVSEGKTEYECGGCGFRSDTPTGISDHQAEYALKGVRHVYNTIAYDYPGEPIYEIQNQWIVDVPETTTEELVGYKCSVCGATK